MNLTTIGIDLAKNVFQIHGVDGQGKTRLRKQLKRSQIRAFFAGRSDPALTLPMSRMSFERPKGKH